MGPVRYFRIFLLEDFFHIFRMIIFKMMKDCPGVCVSMMLLARMLALKIPQKQVGPLVDGVLFLPFGDMGAVVGST